LPSPQMRPARTAQWRPCQSVAHSPREDRGAPRIGRYRKEMFVMTDTVKKVRLAQNPLPTALSVTTVEHSRVCCACKSSFSPHGLPSGSPATSASHSPREERGAPRIGRCRNETFVPTDILTNARLAPIPPHCLLSHDCLAMAGLLQLLLRLVESSKTGNTRMLVRDGIAQQATIRKWEANAMKILQLFSPERMMRWVRTYGKPKQEADENQEKP
jgi:hypothetical protein